MIVKDGQLAGMGAHSYSKGSATGGSEEAAKYVLSFWAEYEKFILIKKKKNIKKYLINYHKQIRYDKSRF